MNPSGQTTTFTMDLNTGLTQALSDGTNTYIYGLDRIAQVNTGIEYFMGDALGSVRQLTNTSGAITYARTYDPYGVVASTSGSSQSAYAFAGESYGDYNELVYLRARYYAPGTGRFLTKDKWVGHNNMPMTFNQWNYAVSNPINFSDPSGNSIYSGICMGQVFSNGLLLNMSAQRLVELCKGFYSQSYWKSFGIAGIGPFDCSIKTQWNKPTTAGELFKDYICETGPEHVNFQGNDVLTQKLARSKILDKIRREFYSGSGKYPYEEQFGSISGYAKEWLDLIVDHEFPLVHVIGSFDVSVMSAGGNRVRFWVHNRTDLASGTHFIGRFPPDGQADNPLTLEEAIDQNPQVGNQAAWWIINTYKDQERGEIVAILRPLARDFTQTGMGGGIYEQSFSWSERNVQCEIQLLPWPIYLKFLDIGIGSPHIAGAP